VPLKNEATGGTLRLSHSVPIVAGWPSAITVTGFVFGTCGRDLHKRRSPS
jgi:hypothetical protein